MCQAHDCSQHVKCELMAALHIISFQKTLAQTQMHSTTSANTGPFSCEPFVFLIPDFDSLHPCKAVHAGHADPIKACCCPFFTVDSTMVHKTTVNSEQ